MPRTTHKHRAPAETTSKAAPTTATAAAPIAAEVDRSLARRARLLSTPFPRLQPFIRQTLTIAPPWAPDCPVTVEVCITPDGSGETPSDPISDMTISPEEELRLAEAGWSVEQHTGIAVYVRTIH